MAEAPSVALKDLMKEVKRLRDDQEKPWHEIAGETGQSAGKCMLAHEMLHLPTSEKVTYKSEADLAKKTVRMRDHDKLSWGKMVARTDVPESRLRTLYESVEGEGSTKGNRIGKGGRHPGDANGKVAKKASKSTRAPKKAPAKKAVAKKAARSTKTTKKVAKKASGARKGGAGASTPANLNEGMIHPFEALDYDALAERLEGRAITVASVLGGGKNRTYRIKAVRSLDDGNMEFSDQKSGSIHTVRVVDIRRATK